MSFLIPTFGKRAQDRLVESRKCVGMASPPVASTQIQELHKGILAWQAALQQRCVPNEHSENEIERKLGARCRKAMARRFKALGPEPSRALLNEAEVALINGIPGVLCSLPMDALTAAAEIGGALVEEPAAAADKPCQRRPAEFAPEVANKRLRTKTTPSTSNAVTLSMRGLNIQWPFSQLILMGVKTEEVREYDLGHRKICTASEETWIVETRGLHAHATTDAICAGLEVAPRPQAAQIVGTVTFDSASKYDGTHAFRSARDRHRIADGSKFDWDGKGSRYGWRVGTARALRNPVPVGSTGMTGFGARSFEVTFASSMAPQDGSSSSVAGHTAAAHPARSSGAGATPGSSSSSRDILQRSTDERAAPQGLSQRPVAMDTSQPACPYYEIQVDAWCGMHAINNFLGGPYCTREDCRSASSQVVAALSEALGGDVEAQAQHLDPETGWLSVDVINVLGAGQLGIHVEGDSMSLDAFVGQGDVDAFVNWNNQHWTVLVGRSSHGPWIHTNSFFQGQQSFHGRVEITESAHVAQILTDIASHCGSYSLHRVVRARPGGDQFLEAAGRRAMLPPEEEVLPDIAAAAVADRAEADGHERGGSQEVSVVTVNVDGMGDYARPAADRITGILQEVLKVSPHFVLLQEVTMAMYVEIKRILADWQVYRRLGMLNMS